MFTLAFWSAVAATFAALSSISIMLIQRRNLLDAARPELVVTEFTRITEDGSWPERIRISGIKNVGRGPALTVLMRVAERRDPKLPPLAVMGASLIPIIGPGEERKIDEDILLWWKNVEGKQLRAIVVTLEIMCWDSRRYRHRTRYPLLVMELGPGVGYSDTVAPGVMLSPRITTSQPVWWLKVRRRLSRVPVVRRWFRPDEGVLVAS